MKELAIESRNLSEDFCEEELMDLIRDFNVRNNMEVAAAEASDESESTDGSNMSSRTGIAPEIISELREGLSEEEWDDLQAELTGE